MRDFICPSCEIPLEKKRHSLGVYWDCPACKGRSSTVSLMRKSVPRQIVNEIWQGVRNVDYPEIRKCSCCPARMEQIPVNLPSGQVLLDVCPRCQFIWFDAGEHARLPVDQATLPKEPELPLATRQQLAILEVEGQHAQARADEIGDGPDELWKYIPAFMGMPVEVDPESESIHAWVTWTLTLIIVAVSSLAFSSLRSAVDAYGMIPAQAARMGGVTLLTSFFLHAGVMHLVGNIYYLLVFGDNVEAVLGKFRFLMLLLLSTLVGNLAHIMADPSSTIPCIGASGGISGVLAFYAIAFPRSRLGIFLWYFMRAGWARVPAVVYFGLWIGLQVLGAMQQIEGIGSVSYLAHLGGVAVGVVFGAVWRISRSFQPGRNL